MSKSLIDHFDDADKQRIKTLATKLVIGQIESGELPLDEEVIRAAMPRSIKDAIQVVNAINEYLAG